jgi:hypothetical protein
LAFYETGLGANPIIPKDLVDPIEDPRVGYGGKIQSCPGEKTKDVVIVDAGLK